MNPTNSGSPPGTQAPFARHWRKLLAAGYSPIPCGRLTKRPLPEGWPSFGETPISAQQGEQFASRWPLASIGLALGYPVVVIDNDSRDPEVGRLILAALPPDVPIRLGNKGFAAFGRTVEPIRTRHLIGRDGLGLIDILGVGASIMIPPSPHPTAGLYRWEGAGLRFPVENLPAIPADITDRLSALLAPWLRPAKPPAEPRVAAPTEQLTERRKARYRRLAETSLATMERNVSSAAKGARNRVLNGMAIAMGVYVNEGILTEQQVIKAVTNAATANGHYAELRSRADREMQRIVQRGRDYAEQQGFALPDLEAR